MIQPTRFSEPHAPAGESASELPRREAIPLAPPAWLNDPVSIRISTPAPMVTAGVVLTVAGSVMSILGSSLWLATRDGGNAASTRGYLGLTLAAEPVMLAGTLLWIYGLMQRPQEATQGERGSRRLAPGGAVRF